MPNADIHMTTKTLIPFWRTIKHIAITGISTYMWRDS